MKRTKLHIARQGQSSPCKSSAGYSFDESADLWMLDGSIELNLSFLSDMGIDAGTARGFRRTLSRYAQDLSASHCANIRSRALHFFRVTGAKNLSVDALALYRSGLADEHIWYLGVLRGFLDCWGEFGYEGLEKQSTTYLDGLTIKGNTKGYAVLTNCPCSGPYTPLEHQSLLFGLANAYVDKRLSQHDYSFSLAVSMTGRRPVQIRYLKLCDLSFEDHDDGCRAYYVNLPRAKQRGAEKFRGQMKRILVCKDLWDSLNDQQNDVRAWANRKIGTLVESLLSQLPLFPDYNRLEDCSESDIASRIETDFFHETKKGVHQLARRLNGSVKASSERTGDRLIIGFTRLRRTYATNLAIEGFGPMVIAEALDHSDTQQVGVYARPEKEIAKQVSKVMAPVLAPLAMAFAGTLVDSERDGIRGDDPHSRVNLETDVGVGTCGNYGFCADGWKSCYVCKNFQPWLDGPHQQALKELEREREDQRKAGVAPKVISASDRTILAITQIIQMCERKKAEATTVEGGCVNG